MDQKQEEVHRVVETFLPEFARPIREAQGLRVGVAFLNEAFAAEWEESEMLLLGKLVKYALFYDVDLHIFCGQVYASRYGEWC